MSFQTRLDVRCPGQKSIYLEPGGLLKIGRRSQNDIVLKGGSVSRHHASLVWDADEDRPYVEDHGSANGVLVDDDPIEGRQYLNDYARLSIGDHTLHCELIIEDVSSDALNFNLGDSSGEFFLHADQPPFKGTFSTRDKLWVALLKLEREARSGTLMVESGGDTASLSVANGRVMAVKLGDVQGLEAMRRVVMLTSGTYVLSPILKPSESFLDVSIQAFLTGN